MHHMWVICGYENIEQQASASISKHLTIIVNKISDIVKEFNRLLIRLKKPPLNIRRLCVESAQDDHK